MKILFRLIIWIYLFITVGFTQTTDFSFSLQQNGCANDTALFTNLSVNALSYEWDFGDGSPVDTHANPVHIYTAGNYVVTLTAFDGQGHFDRICRPVRVVANMNAAIGFASNQVCLGEPIRFFNTTFPEPDSSFWDFGDGQTTTQFAPSHTYAAAAAYTVKLITYNNCGTDTTQTTITVDGNVRPMAAFNIVSPLPSCPGVPVSFNNFSDNGFNTFKWYFGDGDSSLGIHPAHTYADSGNYSVSMIATNACGSDTMTHMALIDSFVSPSLFPGSGINHTCPGTSVDFYAGSSDALRYTWAFGNGDSAFHFNTSYHFTDTGSYEVIVSAENHCGILERDTLPVRVDSLAPPIADFWPSPSFICPGDSVTFFNGSTNGSSWYWDFDNGQTDSTSDPMVRFDTGRIHMVSLIATSSCGTTDTVVKSLFVDSTIIPSAGFNMTPLNRVCPGTAVAFTNNSSNPGHTFWDFGTGDTSLAPDTTYTFTNEGQYTIMQKVSNQCGFFDAVAQTLIVSNDVRPEADFQAFPNSVCVGEGISFFNNANVNTGIIWDYGDGNLDTSFSGYHRYQNPGQYTVSMVVANACGSDTAYQSVNVLPGPVITLDTLIHVSCVGGLGGRIDVTVSGGSLPYTYSWSNNDTTADLVNVGSGQYILTVTDSSGCVANYSGQIQAPGPIFVSDSITDASCPSGSDGKVDLTVSGGTPPYSYHWSSGATTQDLNNLPASTYYVTIFDSNGCVAIDSAIIGQPAVFAFQFSRQDATCGNSDGYAIAAASGGTPPYTFSWHVGLTGDTLTGLAKGHYGVTLTDSLGCMATDSAGILEAGAPELAIGNLQHVSCHGAADGMIDADITGGTAPFNYSWSTGASTQDISGVPAGPYQLTVIDSANCTDQLATAILQPDSLELAVATTDVSCHGGTDGRIDLTVTGGSFPYVYSWSTGDTIQDLDSIPSASYNVEVSDSQHCTQSDTSFVGQPPALTVSANADSAGNASATVGGGRPPYQYLWSNNALGPQVTGLTTGSYTVTVTDSNGCQAVDSLDVFVHTSISGRFSTPAWRLFPNPVREQLHLEWWVDDPQALQIEIFSMLGERVLQRSYKAVHRVMATFDMEAYPSGIYLVRISGKSHTITRKISLSR